MVHIMATGPLTYGTHGARRLCHELEGSRIEQRNIVADDVHRDANVVHSCWIARPRSTRRTESEQSGAMFVAFCSVTKPRHRGPGVRVGNTVAAHNDRGRGRFWSG